MSASHHLMVWIDMYRQQAVVGGEEAEREAQDVGAPSAGPEAQSEGVGEGAGPTTRTTEREDRGW